MAAIWATLMSHTWLKVLPLRFNSAVGYGSSPTPSVDGYKLPSFLPASSRCEWLTSKYQIAGRSSAFESGKITTRNPSPKSHQSLTA